MDDFSQALAASLAAAWAASRGPATVYAPPVLAAVGDTAGLGGFVRTTEEARRRPLPPDAPGAARDVITYLAASGRAYMALVRGDSAEALRLFDALPDSACYGACGIDELTHARLLAGRGRSAEAAALVERPKIGFAALALSPLDVLRALERGRVHERLGNRERAIAGYAFVVEAWRNADPELKAYVDEARAALARLGAEKRAA